MVEDVRVPLKDKNMEVYESGAYIYISIKRHIDKMYIALLNHMHYRLSCSLISLLFAVYTQFIIGLRENTSALNSLYNYQISSPKFLVYKAALAKLQASQA